MDKPGGSFWRWGRRDTHRFLPGLCRAGRGGNGLGDHVRRPCRREWGWGRNPDVEGPSFRAATFSSGSGQSRPRYRQYGIWGVPEALPPAPSPWPSQHRQNRALAEPSRPPSHGHRIPEHPLRSPFDPAGTPPPQVSSGARRAPAPGDRSAGWRRAAAAPEPPPPPPPGLRRTRPRSSVLAVAGRGRTRLQASREGGDRLAPSDRSGLATPGLTGARRGRRASPASPAAALGTPPPLLLRRQLPTPARA